MTRSSLIAGPSSSRRAFCRRAKIPIRALAALASPTAPPLTGDLPRQDSAPVGRTREPKRRH